MSSGRYTDYPAGRPDPFTDRSDQAAYAPGGQSYNYDPYDSSNVPTPSNDIPLREGNPGGNGYTGLPRNDIEADLGSAQPPSLNLGADPRQDSTYYASSGFAMDRGYNNGSGPGLPPKEMSSGSLRPSSSVYDTGPSTWLQEQQKGAKKSKWMIWVTAIVVVALIIVGIVVGVVVSNNNKRKVAALEASQSSSEGIVNQTNPNDPSTFVKDPRLHRSFYGMAYTPENSQLPGCGNKLADVITDIQLLSQLTKRVRLYGADCNQTALVLEAIKRTKVDMEVWLGNYVIPTDNGVSYRRQRDILKEAIETYGTDHIAGITVGNEFMLNYLGANGGGTEPNGAVGDAGADILLADIQDTRDMLASMNLPKTIPVGNSDAGSYFNTKILSAVDYGLSNVHPWFAPTTAEGAAPWTFEFFENQNVAVANTLPNRPTMYIAETGWPTASSDAQHETNGAAPASVAGLQTFLDTFVCQANANGTGYFFFEFFDEHWKEVQFGGVEGFWGLFTGDRKLKDVVIPNCAAP